jgi:hypothetical protein
MGAIAILDPYPGLVTPVTVAGAAYVPRGGLRFVPPGRSPNHEGQRSWLSTSLLAGRIRVVRTKAGLRLRPVPAARPLR